MHQPILRWLTGYFRPPSLIHPAIVEDDRLMGWLLDWLSIQAKTTRCRTVVVRLWYAGTTHCRHRSKPSRASLWHCNYNELTKRKSDPELRFTIDLSIIVNGHRRMIWLDSRWLDWTASDLTGRFDWAPSDLTGRFDWAASDLTGRFDWVHREWS